MKQANCWSTDDRPYFENEPPSILFEIHTHPTLSFPSTDIFTSNLPISAADFPAWHRSCMQQLMAWGTWSNKWQVDDDAVWWLGVPRTWCKVAGRQQPALGLQLGLFAQLANPPKIDFSFSWFYCPCRRNRLNASSILHLDLVLYFLMTPLLHWIP